MFRRACSAGGVLLSLCVCAQNLVPNPGFEELTGPCLPNVGVGYQNLTHWTFPECSLWSEYYHTCNTLNGVPENVLGHQDAHEGEGYIGIVTFNLSKTGGNPRYYPYVYLTEPLEAGVEYCIRLWLSLADTSSFSTGRLHCFLWYGFTTICASQDTAWDTYAQVTLNTEAVNDEGWTLLQGSFTAHGGEANLAIGEFLFGDQIDTTFLGWKLAPYFAAYYLDDVYLGRCDDGVADHEKPGTMELFPNPATVGQPLTMKRPQGLDGQAMLSVVDAQGRLVRQLVLRQGQASVEIDGLDAGAYALWLQGENLIAQGKLIVVGND